MSESTQVAAAAEPRETGPLVSVLMPSYNHEAFVHEAVHSVWRQSHQPLELIAVDDGSSDRTFEILEDLAAHSPVPMVIHRQANRGVAAALNAAYRRSRGTWLTVLASDDAFVETKIERQLAAARARPGCVAVHSDYMNVGADGDPHHAPQGSRWPPAEGDCRRDLLRGRRTVHPVSLMVRRETLAAVGGWDERYPHEDWPLVLRLSARGEIAYQPEQLVLRRVHAGNVSSVGSRNRAFSPDDAAVELLRELCDSDRDYRICASVHVGVVLRNAMARRGWRRAAGAFAWSWRELPSRRLALVGQVASGLRSAVWLHLALPLLPRRLSEGLAAARSARWATAVESADTETSQ